jgi:hypothetical protein
MGVHGGRTSIAPSQMRTPTQPETEVTDHSRALTPTAVGRSRVVVYGRPSTLRGVAELYPPHGVPLRQLGAELAAHWVVPAANAM